MLGQCISHVSRRWRRAQIANAMKMKAHPRGRIHPLGLTYLVTIQSGWTATYLSICVDNCALSDRIEHIFLSALQIQERIRERYSARKSPAALTAFQASNPLIARDLGAKAQWPDQARHEHTCRTRAVMVLAPPTLYKRRKRPIGKRGDCASDPAFLSLIH